MSETKKILKELSSEKSTQEKKPFVESAVKEINKDLKGFLKETKDYIDKTPPEKINKYKADFVEVEGDTRETWENCVANQVVQPLQYFHPKTLKDLQNIIQTAEEKNCKVRAIGSGHSFSDVVQTTDFLLDTHGLKGVIPLDESLLKEGTDTSTLFHTECGIRIGDLNKVLEYNGLALPNMGGYTAQTIVGAASTATHGSGISLGPISDFIQSIVLVGNDGVVYRIEPTDGMTDPDKYKVKYPNNKLVQDDDWFYSANVSMGCTGVVYSVILRVMKKYWLAETRTISDWETVKADIKQGDVLKDNRHYEVLVNPYEVDGKHTTLVTKRNITSEPTNPSWDRGHRNFLTELLGEIPGLEKALLFIFDTFPELTPHILNQAMKGLEDDDYVDISYKVLDLGSANNISAFSAEIGFPVDKCLDAGDHIIKEADKMRKIGEVYFTSPFSLRFVKATKSYLAMMYNRDTCMIEMPQITGSYAGFDILRRMENAMYQFSGRPHWGQVNHLTGSNNFIASMYPKLDKWLEVYNELNSRGTFDNSFTDRCGFSKHKYNPDNE